jgi:hypothetical protein
MPLGQRLITCELQLKFLYGPHEKTHGNLGGLRRETGKRHSVIAFGA